MDHKNLDFYMDQQIHGYWIVSNILLHSFHRICHDCRLNDKTLIDPVEKLHEYQQKVYTFDDGYVLGDDDYVLGNGDYVLSDDDYVLDSLKQHLASVLGLMDYSGSCCLFLQLVLHV